MNSLPEAAKMLGLAPSTLRHQVKNGKLRAVKVARDWFITTEEVERYRAENRRPIEDVPA
jgi:excisionase family DNA binding protein